MKKRNLLVLFFLILIGAFFHFYNMDWGDPFYFNPDERNIASAVSQMQFPHQMNPHFFAYGALPMYFIYFTGYLVNYFLKVTNQGVTTLDPSFAQAIVIGRVYSALFATGLIPLLFFLGKKLHSDSAGLFAAFFVTASVGFIQFAHFGTFEMWLTFFSILLFWQSLNYVNKPRMLTIIFSAFVFGILVSVKVSSLALLPLPVLVLLLPYIRKTHHSKLSDYLKFRRPDILNILRFLEHLFLFIFIISAVYVLTNPYSVINQKDLLSSMKYESSVALGTEPVFYTQNFFNTTPIIYQFLHVYPFLINPLMTVLFIPAFIYLFFALYKKKNKAIFLLVAFFLFLFFSQAFLYVKWTRYMVPTLPFMFLTVAIALTTLVRSNKHLAGILSIEISILIFLNSLGAFSYFQTAFVSIDSRIAAVIFAQRAIPVNANILTEPSDLGVLPFQDAFPHIYTFSFYDMDNNTPDTTPMALQDKLSSSQYIIIPSQRVLQSRMENPTRFPKGYVFYKTLLSGGLGFHKIYETPCDVFCTITYLGDPVYWWEQTASVFDHPTVFIFEKNS